MIVVKFNEIQGRIPRNSIYKSDVPPEVENYKKVISGFHHLGQSRKSQGYEMERYEGRDDKMYRVIEGYSPKQKEMDDAVYKLLARLEYAKMVNKQ